MAVATEGSGTASTRPLLLINDLRRQLVSDSFADGTGKGFFTAPRGEWRVCKPIGCWGHLSDGAVQCVSLCSGSVRYQSSHLVNIVSDDARKVILLAQPVLLHLHLPATLDDRVSCQFTHVCARIVSLTLHTGQRYAPAGVNL